MTNFFPALLGKKKPVRSNCEKMSIVFYFDRHIYKMYVIWKDNNC